MCLHNTFFIRAHLMINKTNKHVADDSPLKKAKPLGFLFCLCSLIGKGLVFLITVDSVISICHIILSFLILCTVHSFWKKQTDESWFNDCLLTVNYFFVSLLQMKTLQRSKYLKGDFSLCYRLISMIIMTTWLLKGRFFLCNKNSSHPSGFGQKHLWESNSLNQGCE